MGELEGIDYNILFTFGFITWFSVWIVRITSKSTHPQPPSSWSQDQAPASPFGGMPQVLGINSWSFHWEDTNKPRPSANQRIVISQDRNWYCKFAVSCNSFFVSWDINHTRLQNAPSMWPCWFQPTKVPGKTGGLSMVFPRLASLPQRFPDQLSGFDP